MYYWLTKENSFDNRKNNAGKSSIYREFNAEFVKELPERLFKADEFTKISISRKHAIDFYRDNQAKYEHQIEPEKVYTNSRLSKGWLNNFCLKYRFSRPELDRNGKVISFSLNGILYTKEDYLKNLKNKKEKTK